MTTLQSTISKQFNALAPEFDVPLAPLTYMKIGGQAEVLIKVEDPKKLPELVRFCATENIPLHVLGGASNVIVDSAGLTGITLLMVQETFTVLDKKTPDGLQLVEVSAGYRTGPFVRQTIDAGFTGLEYFLGVPGRVGGAVYNNAHYLSDLIGEHIFEVDVLTREGQLQTLTRDECQFAYDYSIFHQTRAILLRIRFALKKGEKDASMKLVKEATLYRSKTQPLGDPSSGCYFRNAANSDALKARFPQFETRKEFPAAFLIDQAGLKGKKVGAIQVSEKHAAFLINTGGGTSDQVHELAQLVQKTVQEKYGVALQPEVFTISS